MRAWPCIVDRCSQARSRRAPPPLLLLLLLLLLPLGANGVSAKWSERFWCTRFCGTCGVGAETNRRASERAPCPCALKCCQSSVRAGATAADLQAWTTLCRWAAENAAHLFWRQLGCLQRTGHCAAALRFGIVPGCWQALCQSCVGAVPRPLNYRVSDAVSTHVAPRNDGASVSAADRVHEASETLSSSLALRHHDQMQADAVSQRAVRVLVPRPLTYHVSDAVSMHVARRNGGAPVSGATGVRAHTALAGFISAGSHRARILARPVVSCMGFAACAAAPWSFDLSCTRGELSCKARRTCTMRTRGACTHGAHRLYFSGQSSCLIFRTGVSISRENFAGNAAGGSVNDCSSAKHAAAKLHARAFLVLGLFAFMQNIASVSANWQGARVLSIAVVGSSSESFATKRESAG